MAVKIVLVSITRVLKLLANVIELSNSARDRKYMKLPL